MEWTGILFLIFCFIILLVLLYKLFYYEFDSDIHKDYERMATMLYDGPLSSLLNGSGINNIPRLNLVTTNPEIARVNNCAKGPVYIGPGSATDADCVRTCMNDSAHVVNVADDETVIYDNAILQKGAHCSIGARPECNMRTTIVKMTINSVVCQSKFPRLVGGTLGNNIVACNNSLINDPQNVLWDYKTNERFDPWTTTVLDEDELLPDGKYRFACIYKGEDSRGNSYQSHPHDRLHPIRNYCADLVYRAHPDVRTVWSDDGKTYTCDCGDPSVTRVSRIRDDDPTSQCSDVKLSVRDDVRMRKILTVPYKCFTLYSPLEDVGKYLPCPNDQFTREGSQMASVTVEFSENERSLIEHPLYKDMKDESDEYSGVYVHEGFRIP